MTEALISAAGGAAVVASLAAGFAARAHLAAGLSAPVLPEAVGSGQHAVSWRWLARVLLRPYYGVLALAAWLMLAETALALAAPWPLKIIIDHGIGHRPLIGWLHPLDALRPVTLAAAAAGGGLVLVGAGAVLGYLVTYLMAAVSEHAVLDLRLLALGHLLRIPPRSAARYPLGELTARVGADAARVSEAVVTVAEVVIPETAVLAGMIVVTGLLDWRLTLVALAVVPLLALAARARNRGLRAAQQASRQCVGAASARLTDLLARLPSVHVFDRAQAELTEASRLGARAAAARVTALDASVRFGPVAELLPAIGLAGALIMGTIEVGTGRLTVGGLLVFLAYLASLQAPVRALVRLTTTVSRSQASRERLAELLAVEPIGAIEPAEAVEAARNTVAAPGRVKAGPARRGEAVDMDGLSFSYHPGHAFLRDLELHVDPGEILCLTGPSGAGKSTVLALLMRLATPASGRIRVAGLDTSVMPLHQLTRLITLAPQDPWLHTGSIADNIGYGCPGASLDDIRIAATHAGVDWFARQLPDGYHTPVGEHGRALSGGQARRIALARALLRDCPVLLLDEPTAGLDAQTETDVLTCLFDVTRGKTVVIVSHQPRVMALADRVLVLADGNVGPPVTRPSPHHRDRRKEVGTHVPRRAHQQGFCTRTGE